MNPRSASLPANAAIDFAAAARRSRPAAGLPGRAGRRPPAASRPASCPSAGRECRRRTHRETHRAPPRSRSTSRCRSSCGSADSAAQQRIVEPADHLRRKDTRDTPRRPSRTPRPSCMSYSFFMNFCADVGAFGEELLRVADRFRAIWRCWRAARSIAQTSAVLTLGVLQARRLTCRHFQVVEHDRRSDLRATIRCHVGMSMPALTAVCDSCLPSIRLRSSASMLIVQLVGRLKRCRCAAFARQSDASDASRVSTNSVRGAIIAASSASPNCSSRPNTLRSIGCSQMPFARAEVAADAGRRRFAYRARRRRARACRLRRSR